MTDSFFHTHAHSGYSCLDGMPTVTAMVETADAHGHIGLGLMDHGNMSGVLRLYQDCTKAGLVPFPGIEGYLVSDYQDKDAERFHVGIMALTQRGFQGLSKLSSLSHQRDHYHFKPRFDLSEFWAFGEEYGKDVAVLTGCYFGFVVQTLVRHGEKSAKGILKTFAKYFPNLFVEIQLHNIDHGEGWSDIKVATTLYRMAGELGLPHIVTQDAHYVEAEDRACHDMMKNIIMHKEGEDATFPGDGYHLAETSFVRNHYGGKITRKIWNEAQDSYELLLDLNKLRLPALDNYKFHVPGISKFPDAALKDRVKRSMEKEGLDMWDHYDRRANSELKTIAEMGMSNYFLLIDDICKWCRKNDILVDARGSANGSLVCFLLGITAVDPVEWDLSFDRFLHPSRKKPPDIDLDIDRDKRGLVIEHLQQKYDVMPIGTYSTLGLDEFGKGSAAVKFLSYKRRELGDRWANSQWAGCRTIHDIEYISPEDAATLEKLGEMKVKTSPGTHAAGIVFSAEGLKISDYLATMLIPSSNSTVTQATMDDVENAGYMKGDFLGSATLTHMGRTLELLGRSPVDVAWIPLDDKATFKTLRSGTPDNGIFQFDGHSTARGGKQMGIKRIEDVFYCMALYRTALMKSGHTERYLENRADKSKITYVHPLFEPVLKKTYGVVVFQDQVVELLRQIGMRHEELNDLLKAIKQSNDKVVQATATFKRIKPIFEKLCAKQGFTPQQAEDAWTQIMDFNEYGFNKAHATGYGLRAYRQAYLKTHHPLEFMTALLEVHAGTPKEIVYVKEARRMGIKLMKADVNISGTHWTIDHKAQGIRRGLTSIKGVGQGAAEEIAGNAPYQDIDDLIERTDSRKVTGGKEWAKGYGKFNGVLEKLHYAGALTSLGIERP